MSILPRPKIQNSINETFNIFPNTKIVLHSKCTKEDYYTAKLIQKEIKNSIGFDLRISKSENINEKNIIRLINKEIELDIKNEDINGDIDKITQEAYGLEINKSNISIISAYEKARFYGAQSLRQIIKTEGVEIKGLSLVDYPQFSERGFYHDITRGKVPTLDTLKELVDKASFYKINQLQLYVEHSFAFKNHSEIWSGNDPLRAEEILELDEYCRKNHIELVPSLASFGHLYHALRSYSFNHLCELDNTLDKKFSWIDRMGHHTLNVLDEKSLEFVEDMLHEFIPLFSSDKFNICCDETFDLGEGKSKEKAVEVGKGRLYLDFLIKIISIVRDKNKIPMFWGDIVLKHPELLKEVPQDVVCLNWNYSPEASEESTKIISESGLPLYVCPGVSGWDRLMNDLDGSFKNIYKMINYGKIYNAVGVLNTDWGDYGHINLLANSIPGMIYGAALSWNSDIEEDITILDKDTSLIEFGDKSKNIVSIMREISKAQAVSYMEIVWWKEEKFKQNDFLSRKPKYREKYIENISEEYLHRSYEKAVELEKEVLKLASNVDLKYKKEYMEFYISVKGIALMNALYLIIKKYDLKESVSKLVYKPKELAVHLEYWIDMYCDIWRVRNKESEIFRIKDCFKDICKFLRTINI